VGFEAGRDVFAVSGVLVAALRVDGVGDCGDQVSNLRAEVRGQHRERARTTGGRHVVGVVFD
jgi:hypothetical protein